MEDLLADHAAEQRNVGSKREDHEPDRDADPDRLGVPKLCDRVVETDQVRQQDVNRGDRERHANERLNQTLGLAEKRRPHVHVFDLALAARMLSALYSGRSRRRLDSGEL